MNMSIGGARPFPSFGMQQAEMLQSLGYPGSVAHALGAQADAALGDLPGVLQNLTDMFSKGVTGSFDRLFGGGLGPQNFVPRPLDALAGNFARGGVGFNPFGGFSVERPFGGGRMGRSIERAIKRNPQFKAQMERALGGTIIPDGRNDGKLRIYRPPFANVGDIMRGAAMANRGLAGALAGLALPIGAGGVVGQALTRLAGNLQSFAAGAAAGLQAAGGASGASGASAAQQAGGGGYASQLGPEDQAYAKGMGIDLRNASFEDVLFILLMKYAKKKEDDIMNKVKELDKSMQEAQGGGGKGGKGGKGGGKGGLLGTVGGVVGGMVGGPIGSMAGKAIGGMVGGGGASGASGGGGGGGGMAGANLGEKMDPSKMSDTMKQQMLQKLMGDLQKLYEMLSNMIKSMHDMQMTPTRNLRG